jgi:hypothetical protein
MKRAVTGLVSQMHCGRVWRRAGLGWLKPGVSHFSIERGTFLHSFRVCTSFFHALLRENPSMFMLRGWSSIPIIASLMMHYMHLVFVAMIMVS